MKRAILLSALLAATAAHAAPTSDLTGTITLIPATLMVLENPPTVPAIKIDAPSKGFPAGTAFQIEPASEADEAELRSMAGQRVTLQCAAIWQAATSRYFTPHYCDLGALHKD